MTQDVHMSNRLHQSLKVWEESSSKDHYKREVFEFDSGLLPELRIFGWLSFSKALKGALQADRHPDEIEIHYIKHGHVSWWLGTPEQQHEIHAGKTFIVLPNELHGGFEGSLQPCEHYWLRIQIPPQDVALPNLSVRETRLLTESLLGIHSRSAEVSTEVDRLFKLLLDEHQMDRTPLTRTCARAILHALGQACPAA